MESGPENLMAVDIVAPGELCIGYPDRDARCLDE